MRDVVWPLAVTAEDVSAPSAGTRGRHRKPSRREVAVAMRWHLCVWCLGALSFVERDEGKPRKPQPKPRAAEVEAKSKGRSRGGFES